MAKSWRAGVGLVAAMALAACSALSAPVSESPPYATAAAACHASAGEREGSWRVAVEVDRATASSLALVDGQSIAICMTARDDSGFGSTSVGVGRHPVSAGPSLSYLTGMEAGNEHVLVGRMPPATRRVLLMFGDGSEQDAVLGEGLWLAWLSDAGKPTQVIALGSSGATLGKLSDVNGLQPTD